MNRGLDPHTIDRMLHVDAEHGPLVAAAWANVSIPVVARHRRDRGLRRREGDQRGAPSLIELARRGYRDDCSCPRCCDVRTALMAHQPVHLTAVPDLAPQLPDAEAWRAGAACAGEPAATFFPIGTTAPNYTRAAEFCAHCPVRTECLEYALAHRVEHGMWGGTTERERRRIRDRRRRQAAS